ncbi:TolB-like translocation protein [Parvularcula mediterranea]|nr:PD40 domain-containing protein [Parvularcula mediterranea]
MTKPIALAASAAIALSIAHSEPVRFYPDDLGQDGRITLSPGFSRDGTTLVLAQSECERIGPCPQYLKRSTWNGERWSRPERIPLPDDGRADYPVFAPDGRSIIFAWGGPQPSGAYENFDLFSLGLEEGAEPELLDYENLNRLRSGRTATLRYVNNEAPGALTEEGDLYFFSERLDEGPGERDIFVAPSDGEGGFLRARALGAPINTDKREDTPWVTPDGNLMLFTASSRGGEGNADLFVSTRSGGEWSDPEPLGPEANGPYADFAGRLTPDGQTLVFSSARPVKGRRGSVIQVWSVPVAEVPVLATALKESKN